MLVSGTLLLTACKFTPPTVQGAVYSCVTSQKFQVCKCGNRIIDYTQESSVVGEWENIENLEILPISECPDLVGFSLDDYIARIKPKLKEGSNYYHDIIKNSLYAD
jgi:hypothetical protein